MRTAGIVTGQATLTVTSGTTRVSITSSGEVIDGEHRWGTDVDWFSYVALVGVEPGWNFGWDQARGPVSFGTAYTSELKIDGEKGRFVFGEAFAFCATLSRGAGTQSVSMRFWVVHPTGDHKVAEDVIRMNEANSDRVCQILPTLLIVPGTSPATYAIRMEVGDGKKTLARGAFQYQFPS